MSNITIAIQCALPKEAAPIIAALEGVRRHDEFGVEVAEGTYRGVGTVVCIGGMGTVSAGAATQLIIARCEPKLLIFSGIAGGLNPRLGVGDIVVGAELHYLETNTPIIAECAPYLEWFRSDEGLVAAAERALERGGYRQVPSLRQDMDDDGADGRHAPRLGAGPRYVRGVVATSDQFNTDADVLRHIVESVHADCEEMEGAAAAHVSAKCGVPFLAIRSISNRCGESYESLDGHEHDLVNAADAAAAVTLGTLDALMENGTLAAAPTAAPTAA